MPAAAHQDLTEKQRAFAQRLARRPVRFPPRTAAQRARCAQEQDDAAIRRGEIGHKMHDGSLFAGFSPENGRPLFMVPRDSFIATSWYHAALRTKSARDLGHDDWRLPTQKELRSIFNNRSRLGDNFNCDSGDRASRYWSSTEHGAHCARQVNFGHSDNDRVLRYTNKDCPGLSVRIVRG